MSAAILHLGGHSRHYYFCDSFKGLPPVTTEDGPEALKWQSDITGPRYFNNCAASIDEFSSVISTVGICPDNIHTIAGFYEDTLPGLTVGPIAVLRLDCDWYLSTLTCLEKFWDHLLPGALVIIDDYFDWEGCRKAVHHFLGSRKAPEAILKTCLGGVTYIIRSATTNNQGPANK
jgi:O-methyltransferase